MFVLMADIKTQLTNVAFGGSWSEEILRVSDMADALKMISDATRTCTEVDVRTVELVAALDFVAARIEKGPQLKAQFFKAVGIDNQQIRQNAAKKALRQIQAWAGR